jgi:acetolactate synthase-1/2/3 large subunit
MTQRTGWQAVVNILKAEGVKYLFGMPTSAADLYDALYDAPEIQPILVRHEGAGLALAMGYALAANQPAVCFAGSGPGVANLAPVMLEALATCAPVIALASVTSGQIEGMGAFQETDQIGMMKPLTKWAARVPHAEKIPWAMRRAFSLASGGQPGPVFIELPKEVGRLAHDIPEYTQATPPIRTAADPQRIEQAIAMLRAAQRPLLVLGGGARRSGAHTVARLLAELLGMPVMTTPSGRGILTEDHPLAIGQVGLYRTRLGMQAFEESDLLITVGSRNEEFQTGAWKFFPPGAKFIQVDIEAFEIGRNWIPDLPIVGDAKLVLSAILDGLEGEAKSAWRKRFEEWQSAKAAYLQEVEAECRTDAKPIKTKAVVRQINHVFGKHTILVHENGGQDLWTYYSPYYQVLDLDGSIAPGEQTLMGCGVMGAVGVKLARPEMKVVCVTGDGAFQMYNQDVVTAVQYKAPVTWVILNNYSLGWPKYHQKEAGGRYIATDFEVQPDFVGMARAYQCYGEKISEPESVAPALGRAMQANSEGTPAILEIVIDPHDFSEGFHAYYR